jgi:hypothetical protein
MSDLAVPNPNLKGRDMFQLRAILAAPFMLAAFAAVPAAAQYYPGPPPGYVGPEFRVIAEPQIVSILHSLGFTPIARPRLQGRLWIVRALDEDEMPMRVTLDASTGEVIDAIAIGPGAPPRAPRYGMVPNDLDEPDYPPAARTYPRQPGPRVIYRGRDFYDDELPPPPAGIGPRSNVDAPRGNQARREPAQEQRTAVRPTDTDARAAVPTPRPKPSEIAASGKDPIVTGSVPPKSQSASPKGQTLPPVNPME